MKKILLFVLTVCLLENLQAQYARNSMLDTTFGIGGKVITPLNSKYYGCRVQKVLMQQDGKFIVAGNAPDLHWWSHIMLARYFADGKIDSSFGVNGFIFDGLTNRDNIMFDAALQSDGKIVVVMEYLQTGIDTFGMVRYRSDGKRDNNFGKKGLLTLTVPSYSLVIDKKDNILVGGQQQVFKNLPNSFTVQRFFKNGKQDMDFGSLGTAKITFGTLGTYGIHPVITIDKSSNIILASTAAVEKNYYDFVVIRFRNTGVIDSSFNKKGWHAVNYGKKSNVVTSLTFQGDNIIVGGYAGFGPSDFLIARFKTNGPLDSSFGSDGFVTADFSADDFHNRDDRLGTVIVQSDNKIVATGVTKPYNSDFGRFALARYYPNGFVDKSFGYKGQIVTLFGDYDAGCGASALQANDKILAAGYYQADGSGGRGGDIAMARYLKKKLANPVTESLSTTSQQTISLRLSPNPVNNILTITGLSAACNYQLSICNERGIAILSKKVNGMYVYNFNVSGLPNGIYYMNITSNGGNEKLMFIKE